MTHSPPKQVQKAVNALLTKPGVTTPQLRQAIEARAARLSGGDRTPQEIPREIPLDLIEYVDKVISDPHKVTDEDVERLKAAGYSEDAIFEITLCASVGCGMARLERGLRLLERTGDAPPDS